MKRLTNLTLAGVLLAAHLFIALPPQLASAHEGEDHSKQDAAEEAKTANDKVADVPKTYTFVAEPGCNLSLLTRRALQLFDAAKDDVTLSPAAAIYAETNVVQRLGSRQLAIGERVNIDSSLLDEYVTSSKKLSAARLSAWNEYASGANFAISDINPETKNAPKTPAEEKVEKEQKDAKKAEESKKAQDEKAKADKDGSTNNTSLAAYWWLVGIAVLAGIYYLLGKRKDTK